MKKKIIFEPWIDPLCHNLEKFYPKEVLEQDGREEEDEDLYQDDGAPPSINDLMPNVKNVLRDHKANRRFLMHPAGIIPVFDHHYLANTFNLWIGHTNFDITPGVLDTIEGVCGVEVLEVYTRYRFRVGFGKAFRAAEVISEITRLVCDDRINLKTLPIEVQNKISEIKTRISEKYWGMCIFPNGAVKLVTSQNNDEDFKESLNELNQLSVASNSILYLYDD